MSAAPDDSFELYDLRVEAVVPEGKPIFCGAKPGDYFELRGEMLSLPPGQGFSIYSLSAVLPPAGQRIMPSGRYSASESSTRSCLFRSSA